ncbi:F-box/LRR-repeat protein 8-like [Argonauta hians]
MAAHLCEKYKDEHYCPSMDWSTLPEHIVVEILLKLGLSDRFNASMTCKAWSHCFDSPYLWQDIVFKFFVQEDKSLLRCLQKYGQYFKNLTLILDQSATYNRLNSVALLEHLSRLPNRRLTDLTMVFTEKNPLFYAGAEFSKVLRELFDTSGFRDAEESPAQLCHVNLEYLNVAYDDTIFDHLSLNNPKLKTLNIQNHVLVCKVTHHCILRLAQRCTHLQELHLFYSCLSDDVLLAFSEKGRAARVKHLSLKCRIEDKYHADISPTAWSKFKQANPDLEVKLEFDETCPLHRVMEIMQPQIPVVHLHLDTFTTLYEEVIQTTNFYSDTLRSLVLRTVSSALLQEALVFMASHCKKLSKLHVFCVLEKDVIEKVLELCPLLKQSGDYILKDKKEPEPWVVGREDDEW